MEQLFNIPENANVQSKYFLINIFKSNLILMINGFYLS